VGRRGGAGAIARGRRAPGGSGELRTVGRCAGVGAVALQPLPPGAGVVAPGSPGLGPGGAWGVVRPLRGTLAEPCGGRATDVAIVLVRSADGPQGIRGESRERAREGRGAGLRSPVLRIAAALLRAVPRLRVEPAPLRVAGRRGG